SPIRSALALAHQAPPFGGQYSTCLCSGMAPTPVAGVIVGPIKHRRAHEVLLGDGVGLLDLRLKLLMASLHRLDVGTLALTFCVGLVDDRRELVAHRDHRAEVHLGVVADGAVIL